MPCPTAPARQPEGCLVVEEVAEHLSADDADPGREGEEGELQGREAVAAGHLRRLEVDGEGGGLHDGQAEGDEDVGADEELDGREGNDEGDRGTGDLV